MLPVLSIRDDSGPIHTRPRILVVEDYWLIAMHVKSVFEKGHGHRLTRVAEAAMVTRVSATEVSCL